MKQLIYILLITTLFACKKEGSGNDSTKLLMAKVFVKGLLDQENIYSTEGKLVRTNHYLTGGGVSKLSVYRLYDYDNSGRLVQAYHMGSDHAANIRKVYTYDAQDRISRLDEASVWVGDDDLENFDYFETFEYDNKGQLTQVTRKLANQTTHSRNTYSYDEKGNLLLHENYLWENGAFVLKQKLLLEPGPKTVPGHWKKAMIYPTDDNLYEHYVSKKTYTSYYGNPAGLTSEWTYPQRTYNSQGYVITAVSHFKSGNTESDTEYTYEYVQQ